jgi:hypothetical protein
MIETIDANLKAWALRETGAAAVSFGPVAAGTQAAGTQNVGAQGLQFTLLDLLPFPAPRGPIPVPYRYTLRYLVTVTAATPEAAHAQLGRVLLAAMKDPEMQEELGPVSPALFQALGWPPQPAFYLRVPVSVPADYTPAPLAREHVLNLRPWPFQATDAPERSTTDAPALSNTDAALDRPNPG